MRVMIVGCGRVGSTLARILSVEHEVTVLDLTSDAFRRLGTKFKGSKVVGMGTDIDALRKAKIEGTDVFVAVTDGDNRNIMAAQVAKHVFNVPKVMMRLYDPSRAAAYQEMGIETICTTAIAASLLHEMALDTMPDTVAQRLIDFTTTARNA
jgi:trk system potassium uptake protein